MENPPQTETSKSIFRNILYGFSTWILPLGLSFLATPLIVKNLGNDDYGIYTLVLSVAGYTFNLSFGRAVTKYIAEYRANGETEKIRDVISASFFINTAIGLVSLLIICLSAEWVVSVVLQIGQADHQKTVTALYVAAFIIFSLVINQVFNAILQGIHRFDVYSKIFNFNNVLTLTGSIVLAYNYFGIISLLIWNLVVNCLSAVLYIFYSKRSLPEFGLEFKLKPRYLKLILSYSAGIIGYQVLANALVLFERFWITRQLGTEKLTFYVIPMSLAIYIHGFLASVLLVIFPLASELQNEKEKLLKLYTKATKMVCFFVFFLATTLIVGSRVFLTLWLDEKFAEAATELLIIHTVTFSLLAIMSVSWQMIEGLGYPLYNTLIFMVCLIINVCLIIWLTQSLGNTGIALGRLAGFGTIFFSIYFVERWVFKRILIKFWLKLLFRLSFAAILAGWVQQIILNKFQIGWAVFISAAVSGGIIYCLTLLILGFVTKEEKLLLRNLIFR